MSDLRQRVPGHSLVEELLRQWELGTIHLHGEQVVIDPEAESWYRGVLGERRVALILDRLGPEYLVLHSVPVGSGNTDIDHVVVGPSGVFTINTKFSPGKSVWVAGRRLNVDRYPQHYILNSLAEARRASRLLSQACGIPIPVTALIVFVDPARILIKEPAAGDPGEPPVQVLQQTELLAAIRTAPVFGPERAVAIMDVAAKPGTWHQAPPPETNGQHISLEFAALEEAVGPKLGMPVPAPTRAAAPGRASAPSRGSLPKRPARAAVPSRAPRSPRAALRGSTRRKPKRSPLERLVAELTLPIGAVVGLLIWWNSSH